MGFFVKKVLPHLVAVLIFLIISVIYCKPALEGKVLQQGDVNHWRGMVHGSQEAYARNGEMPLWNADAFGGMPNYQVSLETHNYVSTAMFYGMSLFLNKPFQFFFLACLGFYILGLALRVNPWISILGALAYAFSTYNPIIIATGHDTKMLAIAYMPALLGSVLLIYNKKYLTGTLLTALFTSIMVAANHYQITYYFIIVAFCMTVALAINWIRQKDWKHIGLAAALTVIAGATGVLTNSISLLTTFEYAKETIRGGKEALDAGAAATPKATGLDKKYAFDWSYGISETMTLIVANTYGGATGGELDGSSNMAKRIMEKGVSEDQATNVAQGLGRTYWGAQPFTEGPVYLGAIICFLFIFGMVYARTEHKWWILAASLIACMMAWGKHLPGFNYFLFDHLPFYNKFRAPAMILVIPQLLFPMMGILALNQLAEGKDTKEYMWKKLKLGGIITAAVLLFSILQYATFDYRAENKERTSMILSGRPMNDSLNNAYPAETDNKVMEQLLSMTQGDTQFTQLVLNGLRKDRQSLFGNDLFRSVVFIALAFGLLFVWIRGMTKWPLAVAGLAVLILIDLIPVDRRYLNDERFLEPEENDQQFNQYAGVDAIIKKDRDLHYRVYNTLTNPTTDAVTTYNHRSLSGYHAAKLVLFQDLLEQQILRQNPQVFNMLNVKYFIGTDSSGKRLMLDTNRNALGNAWLVKNVQFVDGPKAEMRALDNFDPKATAFVDKKFESVVKEQPRWDSSASIKLTKFEYDALQYQYNAPSPQFALFSEIYYKQGWNAYIDDKPAEYVKANYVLRGMPLPAGSHKIDFRFEPASLKTGKTLAFISQAIILLLALAVGYGWLKSWLAQRQKTAGTKPAKK